MANGYVAPLGKFIAFNNAGLPLVGGRVYTFQTGGTTPTPTWSDQPLTVQNANPVILDSAGRASIFIADASVMVYLFVVKDANDVLVYSQDGISIPAPPASSGGGGTGTGRTVPPGTILPYGGAAAPNWTGDNGAGVIVMDYIVCDGQLHSRFDYARLFAVIGDTYGVGDNATTFAVPDLRQRFPLGIASTGPAATRGVAGGAFDHRHQGGQHRHGIPAHRHGMSHYHQVPHAGWVPNISVPANPAQDGWLQVCPAVGTGPETNVTVAQVENASGTSSENYTLDADPVLITDMGGTVISEAANPPYLTVNYIIKT